MPDTEDSYPWFPATPSDDVGQDHRYRLRSAGGYVQLRHTLLDGSLTLVPGLRYDYNSVYENSLNPRIGLVYELSRRFLLKANYATGFQYPSPDGCDPGGYSSTTPTRTHVTSRP